MCLGGICSCAYAWHYDSEYRSERVLAVQTCIFVDFVCFQNMNSNKLCVYQAFRHTCFGGACMLISRTERYARTYSLLKGNASNMLWMCVCVYQAFRLTCIGRAKSIFSSTTCRYLCGGAIIVYVYQLNCTWIGVFSLWRS